MSRADEIHEWDAAYVLGALSPDDRRAFEEHLEGCDDCRASVAELAGVPALLARVPVADALAMIGEQTDAQATDAAAADARRTDAPAEAHGTEAGVTDAGASAALRAGAHPGRPAPLGPPPELLPGLIQRVRRRRRTRRWVLAGVGVLAAAAIAAAVVVPLQLNRAPAPTTQLALTQAEPGPLSATVALTEKRWGTEVTMECRYDASSVDYSTAGHYALYVTDAAGDATRVSSWSAWPGADIHTVGAVDLPESGVRTVELRDASTNEVLLSSKVH